MLDTLTSENHRDFNARYRGTYGWLVDENKVKTFVYISNVNADEVTFTTMEGGRYHAYADKEVMFEFLPVTRGWFRGKSGNKYLLTRRPARQWHRGICANNTSILMFNEVFNKPTYIDFGSVVMGDIFNKNKDAEKYVCANNEIFSKQFAIFNGQLFFFERVIGMYKDNTIALSEEASFLKQELQDIAKRNEYKVEISA